MCETCISTKHEAVFLRDHAVIEESISKHDEARLNPNDISDGDIPIDSDTNPVDGKNQSQNTNDDNDNENVFI